MKDDGEEVAYSEKILPGQEVKQQTYFTHSWIFKVTGTNITLHAKANGYESTFFKALNFGVTPGMNFGDAVVRVDIADGKYYLFLQFISNNEILFSKGKTRKIYFQFLSDCTCIDLIDPFGFGNCGLYGVCYVNQPTSCSDALDSLDLPGEKISSEPCKGRKLHLILTKLNVSSVEVFYCQKFQIYLEPSIF